VSAERIGRLDLLRVGLRLLLLQSSWSEGILQSVGLAYCLVPGLRRIHENRDDLNAAIRRHRTPFNTHPFLAGVVAGAVLRMEADGAPPQQIASFTRDSMGPLGAVGDPFFRGALAPAASLIAALVALLGGALAGAVTLLVVFNLPHLIVRIAAVTIGFRDGPVALARAGGWVGPRKTRGLKLIAALAGGALLGTLVLGPGAAHPVLTGVVAIAVGLGCALTLALERTAWSYVVPLALATLMLGEMAI